MPRNHTRKLVLSNAEAYSEAECKDKQEKHLQCSGGLSAASGGLSAAQKLRGKNTGLKHLAGPKQLAAKMGLLKA
jgi:hypothetical protein